LPGFEICGIVTRSPEGRDGLNKELEADYPGFSDFYEALAAAKPDAVSISTYIETHAPYALAAIAAGCHVFIEKPLAETVAMAQQVVDAAKAANRKLVIGYILRHHPSWNRFTEIAQGLGKPLVMRMNLNQQSAGSAWKTHLALMSSVSPVVDCGVHYVDVMCRMTGSKPVRVSGIGARLSDELPEGKINYAHLQVTFEDGSVGWYEAGWGPMMSETAFFVKDVVGPKGCASIIAGESAARGQSANVDAHTGTQNILIHHSTLTPEGTFAKADEEIALVGEPDHDGLCRLEQEFFLNAILHDTDLTAHMEDAITSMRIVEAADESFRTGKTVEL
jgi:predicted dehydrogenase